MPGLWPQAVNNSQAIGKLKCQVTKRDILCMQQWRSRCVPRGNRWLSFTAHNAISVPTLHPLHANHVGSRACVLRDVHAALAIVYSTVIQREHYCRDSVRCSPIDAGRRFRAVLLWVPHLSVYRGASRYGTSERVAHKKGYHRHHGLCLSTRTHRQFRTSLRPLNIIHSTPRKILMSQSFPM